MKLADLIPAVQTAFYEGRLTVAHALEIARLQPRDQERALAECFPGHRSAASILKDRKAEAVSVRELREWIEREIHLDLKNAPFETEDANLLSGAGACTVCPKRTGNNPLLFPEIRNKSLCTDPACYQAKIQAFVEVRVEPLVKEGQKPIQVSETPYWQAQSKTPGTLYEGQYRRAEREGECPHTQVAVIIDGRKAGTVVHVCAEEKCKTHRQFSHYEISPQEREQRRKLCACSSGSEGITFAHFAGGQAKTSAWIGACGLRDGCAGLLPASRSRQSSSVVPGLWVGREEDQDIVGREHSRSRRAS